jgi:Tol biopolymer transport system component
LLFWRDGAIHAQGLDPQRFRLQGEARSIADDVALTIDEWATFSVSNQGTLVYHRAAALPWRLEWRERSGRLVSVAAPEGQYASPALSPDGRRVAYVMDNLTLWALDLARGTNTRLTFDGVDHYSPTWAPGGDWLAYAANQGKGGKGGEIRRQRSSGLGPSEVLYSSQDVVREVSWSPDGRWLAFREYEDLHLLDLESRETHDRVATPGSDWYPRFSPDGRWLAYTSNESGRDEVYVVPTFDGPGKWQVSNGGGSKPEWGRDGRELFFLGLDDEVRVASVGVGKDLQLGAAELLFALPGASGASHQIAPDGRLLIRTQTSKHASEGFMLVLNWPRLLE